MAKRILFFVDRLHWLWLTLAAPFLLFPSPKTSLAMLIVPALILIRWLALKASQQMESGYRKNPIHNKSSIIPITPLNGALLLLMLMVLVSLWATFDINYSLPKISGLLLGIAAYLVVVREGTNSRGWFFGLLTFLSMGLGIATLGLFGTNWVNTKITQFNPIIARLPKLITGLQGADSGFHPNEVAGSLVWVLPMMFVLSLSMLIFTIQKRNERVRAPRKTWRENIPSWCLVAATILCLLATFFIAAVFLLTQSRGGYISLILTLPVLIIISMPSRFRWHTVVILAFFSLVVGFWLASNWGTVRDWANGSDTIATLGNSLETIDGRLEVWSRAIYGIQDFPFTGMGMNAFRKVVPVLYPLFMLSNVADIGHAHNEFLQVALDLGIPGLISFLALYVGAFWTLVNILKTTHKKPMNAEYEHRLPFIRLLALGLGGGLLAHLLFGLTDAVALGAKPGLLFWMLLGLIVALGQQAQKLQGDPERSALVTEDATKL